MKYEDAQPISRNEAQDLLASGDIDVLADTLLRVSLYDPDADWVLTQLERAADHPNAELRGLAATCVGHVGRIRRTIDLTRAGALLDKLALDPLVAPRARDAWEDLAIFVQDSASR